MIKPKSDFELTIELLLFIMSILEEIDHIVTSLCSSVSRLRVHRLFHSPLAQP